MSVSFEEVVRVITRGDNFLAPFAAAVAIATINVLLLFMTRFLKISRNLPVPHKICVIGLPSAGKTTLITALFELIQRGETQQPVRLHGLKTINIVNRYIELLNSGSKVGPTFEKDIFVFRFSYGKPRLFGTLKELYDVEIADFPGEYSKSISRISPRRGRRRKEPSTEGRPATTIGRTEPSSTQYEDEDFSYVLFDKEFYSWVATAQQYLFVIDLGSIYGSAKPYAQVAEITARVRASWQVIEDAVAERGIGSPNKRPVNIVFTKFDCFSLVDGKDLSKLFSNQFEEDTREKINSNCFKENLTKVDIIDGNVAQTAISSNDAQFDDLISFFKSRRIRTRTIYTSMTVRGGGSRFGVRALLGDIIP